MAKKRIPRIKTVMTAFPHAMDVDASLREARPFMRKHQIRHLPVKEDGALVGVITDRDIKLVLGPDFDYPRESELLVRDVYIPDPYIVNLSERLDTVLLAMAERRIGSVLVTRKGKLVGIFTVTDACKCFGEYLREQFPPDDGNDAA